MNGVTVLNIYQEVSYVEHFNWFIFVPCILVTVSLAMFFFYLFLKKTKMGVVGFFLAFFVALLGTLPPLRI